MAARRARAGRQQTVDDVLLDRLQPCTAPRRQRMGRQIQGQVRPGLGQAARGDLRAPEETRHHPAGDGTDRAPRSLPSLGHADRRPEEAVHTAGGGLRWFLRERRLECGPPARLHRRDGRSRQHADHLHLGRQRLQHGRHDHRLVQRDDLPQRHRARRRAAVGR